MILFWILCQINFIALTLNENITQILDIIKDSAGNQHYNTYDKQNEIILLLDYLEIEPNEECRNEFSKLYEKLVKKTKNKINKYVEKTKEYQENQKLFEGKLAESEQKDALLESIKEIRKEEQSLFKDLIHSSNDFVDYLKKCETLFTDHLQFLRFGNEKIILLKEEAIKKIKIIDQIWKNKINHHTKDEYFKLKQEILIQAQQCWDEFKSTIDDDKSNKSIDLSNFNDCFYNKVDKIMTNQLRRTINPEKLYDFLIDYFSKGLEDIFLQLKNLTTLKYFEIDRTIELDEQTFLKVTGGYFETVTNSFNGIFSDTSNLILRLYNESFLSKSEETSDNSISTVIEKMNTLNKFLMEIRNKPTFLVVKLERVRQLLNKLKKEVSTRLGSAFIEEKDLLPAFKNKELQKYLHLSFSKEFSSAEKIIYFLFNNEIGETEFPSFKYSFDELRSAIARYEYYLTCPFLLSEDKESLFTPERGVGRYCRDVFGCEEKGDCSFGICSEEAESFPLILWKKSEPVSTEEQFIPQKPSTLSNKIPFKVFAIVLVVLLGLSLIIIRCRKSKTSKSCRKRKFANKSAKKGEKT